MARRLGSHGLDPVGVREGAAPGLGRTRSADANRRTGLADLRSQAPKTEAEIIEDFRYGFLLLLGDNDLSGQPAAVKMVFAGLESGDLKFEVDTVTERVGQIEPLEPGPRPKS